MVIVGDKAAPLWAQKEIKRLEADYRALEAERDRLTDRIKELEDALAEEISLADSREADIARLKANLLSLLRAIEVKEIDDLMTKNEEHFKKLGEVIKDSIVEKIMEINRLTKLGEERHIRAKDTEEGLMEHVERLKVENERLRKIITEEINLLHDEGEHVWADCLESDLYDKPAVKRDHEAIDEKI